MKRIILSLLGAVLAGGAGPDAANPRTAWFEDARFGMFIHFGLYSVPAGVWEGKRVTRNDYAEWIRYQHDWPKPGGIPKEKYDTLLDRFNPVGFDADAWIREAKNAGMKYFLITAKHHDGFALWDSKVSGYNVVKATPFKRDILAELTAACRKHGLRVGFYYSHWLDWEYPGGGLPPWPETKGDPPVEQPSQEAFEGYWTKKCLPQVKELLVNFEPDFLWFDSWGSKTGAFLTKDRLGRLISLIRETRPACLINSRIGTKEGVDFLSMGDNFFPDKGFDQAWETSGTLNHSWGYHRLDFKWKPVPQLLRYLVNNVSRGGNYQLNVGPTDAGVFQPAAIRRLREIGAWMAANGEAIHGTRPAPWPEPKWGRLTVKQRPVGGRRIYAHVFDPQPGAKLVLTGPAVPAGAVVLESGEPVVTEAAEGGFSFTVPAYPSDGNILVIAFDEGPAGPAGVEGVRGGPGQAEVSGAGVDEGRKALMRRMNEAREPAVLFVGNSYSFDVPGRFRKIAEAEGRKVVVEQVTKGGWTLAQHAASEATLAKIRSRKWDAVVLQEQSQLPSFPAAQRDPKILPALKTLVAAIGQVGAVPLLYETWGRRDGDKDNARVFPGDTYQAMQARLDECFAAARAAEPSLVGVPVGQAWSEVMKTGGGRDLYVADGSHPSKQGVHLAAAVFYSTLFGVPVKSVAKDVAGAGKFNEVAAKVGCGSAAGR